MFTTIIVIFRILVNPLVGVFQKRICTEGQSPLAANFVTYFGLSLLILPCVWSIFWTMLPWRFWGNVFLVGILGALGNGFLVKAMQCGEVSVLGPINAWKSVVGMILGIFLLGEIPNGTGLTGLLLIFAGSYLIVGFDPAVSRFSWNFLCRRDVQYRITAMVLAAVEAIFIKKMILDSNPYVASVFWCWSGAVFSFLFLFILGKTDWQHEWNTAKPLKGEYFVRWDSCN